MCKYIGVDVHLGDIVVREFLVFSNNLVHAEVAAYFTRLLWRHYENAKDIKVASAGFYSVTRVAVFGRSESLNVDSDPDDAARIATMDYGGMIIDTPVAGVDATKVETAETAIKVLKN